MATITPPSSNIELDLKVFDVGDPFNELHADMANVILIDGNTVGGDNRGSGDPAVGNYQAVTDGNGRASVPVTVSMHPGNNDRAAATFRLTIEDLRLSIAGALVLRLGVRWVVGPSGVEFIYNVLAYVTSSNWQYPTR